MLQFSQLYLHEAETKKRGLVFLFLIQILRALCYVLSVSQCALERYSLSTDLYPIIPYSSSHSTDKLNYF